MRIDIITLFPEMFDGIFQHSILKRAQEKGLLEVHLHQLRTYSKNKQRSVDDYPYGGEPGMVMCIDPIVNCIESLQAQRTYDEIIFTSPDAPEFTQAMANDLSLFQNLIILCGHYKGIDERVREHIVTKEISIGSYVLSGGELAAAVITDAVARLIPGVLNDETSALNDSYQNDLLSAPVYTRPADYRGWKVPAILLSGNDKLIADWRMQKSIERTLERKPNLLKE
ncbi:MAG: tRNA (guanosine(37)-N1)-methyltransferase TrmD [Bacteroidales bacterium]